MESEGRLEICSSRSIWGTVCNRQWTDANSKVACRTLGFDFMKGKYFAENRAFSFKTTLLQDLIRLTKHLIGYQLPFLLLWTMSDAWDLRAQQADVPTSATVFLDVAIMMILESSVDQAHYPKGHHN